MTKQNQIHFFEKHEIKILDLCEQINAKNENKIYEKIVIHLIIYVLTKNLIK